LTRRRRIPRLASARLAIGLATAGSTFAPAVRADAGGPGVESVRPTSRPADIVVWPTLTPAGDDPAGGTLHRASFSDPQLGSRAEELDATLRDAAQDLGNVLDMDDAGPAAGHARDTDLIERAAKTRAGSPPGSGTWVVSARLEHASGDSFLVRIVVVPPNGAELRVRVETVKGSDIPVRGLVMLRDLLSPQAAAQAEAARRELARVDPTMQLGVTSPPRSAGRALLAVNGALFGAYVAYSIQFASGSNDPRVLYPLLTLGTGIGLGSAILVSEEWDVSTGAAWYLAAGAWWGAGAGILIANGAPSLSSGDPYTWGVVGGLGGLTLATVALTRKTIDEGGAALTHSGAGLGFVVGGLGEFFYKGSTVIRPYTGSGYGAAVGLVGAGAAAEFVQVSASRVLLVDLGAGLGGLAGAATASPLVFRDVTAGSARGFVAATIGGTLVGGGVGWYLTRGDSKASKKARIPFDAMPTAGVIGESSTRTGSVPVYGVGLSGGF
jgi:hypothetical protein